MRKICYVKEGERKSTLINSPTYGQVIGIEGNKITTLIDAEDIHTIYSSVDGEITGVKFEKGEFKHHVFECPITKKGRATLEITDDNKMKHNITLEVGKGYITNRVRLDKDLGDVVKKGELIGEILLGSLSEVIIPQYDEIKILVSEGDKVKGGETPLAFLEKWERPSVTCVLIDDT
jgi:phosphatidylserine decarboxylase